MFAPGYFLSYESYNWLNYVWLSFSEERGAG
jgi:hypothetical protein